MGHADAEEAASNGYNQADPEKTTSEVTRTNAWKGVFAESDSKSRINQEPSKGETQKTANATIDEEALTPKPSAEESAMKVTAGSAKRPFEEAGDETREVAAGNEDEPPPKAVTTRRMRFLPKPNVPPDRKKEGTTPS
ncbi:hypothetical protein HPB52_007892 [Rhipicephalus sanguineus]|uniref:Uncharacterized protein n=1 Tax=Rhipicephalus sanguineus TaxID=34632 RepID=A0A9D4PUY7_RHISA|nr:hypothetical protein HPB52_007892 [Rhipicephalus sanguineus]